MKKIAAFIGIWFAFAAPARSENTQGQDQLVYLTCRGTLTQYITDNPDKKDNTVLNVVINPKSAMITIEGDWGCTMAYVRSDTQKCNGPMPIKVHSNKFSYSTDDETKEYSASSSFDINRYSGTFRGSSSLYVRPTAKTQSQSTLITSELQCEVAKKQL